MKISDLAREYAKSYIKFLIDNDITISSKDAYNMFRYVIHSIYGYRCGEIFPLLVYKYNDCRECMEEVKRRADISDKDSIKSVIECSCVYTLVSIQYCAGNIKSRLVVSDV